MQRFSIELCGILLIAAGCGNDGTCPSGSLRLGNECVASAGPSDASIPDADGRAPCGNGQDDPGETCDDGNTADGDGCSSECDVEDPCALGGCVPEAPALRGAPSMAPGRELFTWSMPDGTTRIELRLDGASVATPDEPRLRVRLSPGDHTLQARACNDVGCSSWAERSTVVESFGAARPVGLTDTARKLSRTSLGHDVALGCARCLSDEDGTARAPDAAIEGLTRALTLGSDVIHLSVASIEGELRATPRDSASADDLPSLADILSVPALRDGDALVLLDLVENEPRLTDSAGARPFAEALRAALEAAPHVGRNGRPLLVRSSFANRSYLTALHDALRDVPELEPYVRYVLRDPEEPVGNFFAPDALSPEKPLVPDFAWVDAVSFSCAAPDLPNRITLSRRAGRAVIVDDVPGSAAKGGHALIIALRDQADVILTRYVPDRARQLVELPNHTLYVDGTRILTGDQSVEVQYDDPSGALGTKLQPMASFAAPLREQDPTSGLLPPAIAFKPDISGGISSVFDTRSSSDGFMLAAFGSPRSRFAMSDGRAFVVLDQPPSSQLYANITGGDGNVSFVDADFVAACGKNLGSLLSWDATHWLVVYRSTAWTAIIDGACIVSKPSSVPVPAAAVEGSPPSLVASDASISAASLVRFPAGYDTDRGL
jgi:cysteine-rich repeat protein